MDVLTDTEMSDRLPPWMYGGHTDVLGEYGNTNIPPRHTDTLTVVQMQNNIQTASQPDIPNTSQPPTCLSTTPKRNTNM